MWDGEGRKMSCFSSFYTSDTQTFRQSTDCIQNFWTSVSQKSHGDEAQGLSPDTP